ncbi:amidase family protein, partial [Achromobacter spanius]|uniref:amidase family protein n=1 Tax=Achromobacter spanius TaxID=217203 RepID=UPI0032089E13
MNDIRFTVPAESDLLDRDLTGIAALIRSRDISPVDLTRTQLRRIEARDGALRSYACVTAAAALHAAQAAETEIRGGRYRGPLHGIPVALKDLCRRQG